MKRILVLGVLIGLLATACGQGRGPGGGSARGPATPAETGTGSMDHTTDSGTHEESVDTPAVADHEGAHGKGEADDGPAAAYDQLWMASMVDHHQSAIEMAELAEDRAEHPEIRDLARAIVDAQRAEQDRMEELSREWYGAGLDELRGMDHGMPGMDMEGAMGVAPEELREAEPFDRTFIDAIIPHHESAVESARDALERAEHPELRELARDVIETQTREIEQMRAWRAEWYGS